MNLTIDFFKQILIYSEMETLSFWVPSSIKQEIEKDSFREFQKTERIANCLFTAAQNGGIYKK